MTALSFSRIRHSALSAVSDGHVCYHPGLSGPALGYAWSESTGGQMFDDMRHVLSELWAADLIDIADHRQCAQRGHRVSATDSGQRQLDAWNADTAQRVA